MKTIMKTTMKKQLTTIAAALSVLLASAPVSAYAATQNLQPSGTDTVEVVASAQVTEDELAALGVNVIVSIPTELTLSMDSSKNFSGSDKIYAYGIMDADSSLSVTIDATHAAYGQVRYRKTASDSGTVSDTNFSATVTETLSKEQFSAEETKANYLAQQAGGSMAHDATLEVSIKNLLPLSGTGIYTTNVPLKVELK